MQREIKFRAYVPKGYKRWRNDREFMLSWEDLIEDVHSEINATKSVLGSLWYQKDPAPIFMQYTGLKDRKGVADIYEQDIIDVSGNIIGNVYETPEIHEKGANHTVARMGSNSWRESESIAMGRGCKYAEQ